MTYSDSYNIRTTSVKFNDVADAIDGSISRSFGGTTTGTNTAYIATPSPAWTAYDTASFITIIPHVTNANGPVTLNISGIGTRVIKRGGSDIVAGVLSQGIPTILVYTGSYFDVIAAANSLLLDGSSTMLGSFNAGGFRTINLGAATARTDAAQVAQVQDGDYIWLGTTSGSAAAMTANASPPITAYKNGQKFRMKPGFSSTGTTNTTHTLAVNGLSPITILDGGQSPTLGSWETGTARVLELVYLDGFFLITSAVKNLVTWTPTLTPQNGTATGTAFSIAKYQRINGNSCNITLRATWTQNTAAANYVDITLPIRPSVTYQGFDCAITTGANIVSGFAIVASTVGSGTVRCYDSAQGAIATGAKELILSGTYEIG